MGQDAIIKVRGELTPAKLADLFKVVPREQVCRNPTSLREDGMTELNVWHRYYQGGVSRRSDWMQLRTILYWLLEQGFETYYYGDYYQDPDEWLTPVTLERLKWLDNSL